MAVHASLCVSDGCSMNRRWSHLVACLLAGAVLGACQGTDTLRLANLPASDPVTLAPVERDRPGTVPPTRQPAIRAAPGTGSWRREAGNHLRRASQSLTAGIPITRPSGDSD